jgi:uncharacterized membrane protein
MPGAKALHTMFMVNWLAGLFHLPRLSRRTFWW